MGDQENNSRRGFGVRRSDSVPSRCWIPVFHLRPGFQRDHRRSIYRGLLHGKWEVLPPVHGIKSGSRIAHGAITLLTTTTAGLLRGNKKISDAGLVQLKGFTILKELNLVGTKVTDAGLVHLVELPNLQDLKLGGTKITDAGLVHLLGLTNLQTLSLSRTQVTDTGIAELQKTLPNCRISK